MSYLCKMHKSCREKPGWVSHDTLILMMMVVAVAVLVWVLR